MAVADMLAVHLALTVEIGAVRKQLAGIDQKAREDGEWCMFEDTLRLHLASLERIARVAGLPAE